ncbi:hypothetical protein F5X99DRAFT_404216 [Biscogniauxia marginata]|nr:hypothetical protein F5X99DRAFT_404216 [Biscogniauxia marginata]
MNFWRSLRGSPAKAQSPGQASEAQPQAQSIPCKDVDPSKLSDKLIERFGVMGYKVKVNNDSYNIFAARKLSSEYSDETSIQQQDAEEGDESLVLM